jgi:hypothetical protein
MKRWLILAGMAAVMAAWAQTNAPAPGGASASGPAATDAGSVRGFIVPEYDVATGQLKWKLFGDTARVLLTGGKVEVRVMKIEVYHGDAVDMTMRSPVCLFDRGAKLATSDEAVEIVATNMVVTGKGFDWNAADNMVKIRNDVTVTLHNRQGPVFLPIKP